MRKQGPGVEGGKPRRVAHVLWRLSKGGGIPVVVRSIVSGIDPSQVELHLVTLRPLFPEDELGSLPSNVRIQVLGHSGELSPWDRLCVMIQVAARLKRLRPDVVQAHTGTAWMSLLARCVLPRKRFLLEVHDAPRSGRHRHSTDWFEGLLARRFGFHPICHSTSVQSDVATAWRVPPSNGHRFPLGIDTELFWPQQIDEQRWRSTNGLPADRPLVLYVARLVPTKNVALFIDVAGRVIRANPKNAPVFAVIAGGPERDMLRERISSQGLKDDVFLLPPRYGKELAEAYAAADIFCSTSDYEGFGLAVVEAMSSGLPVVATRVGGHTDLVVEGTTGVLADKGDRDELCRAINKLLADLPAARQMGEAGRQRAMALFDVDAMVRAFEACYVPQR